jgi:hypothetical protein
MPTRPCPHCRTTVARHLPHSSTYAVVDYFRCDTCGDVFTVKKTHPDGPFREVTIHQLAAPLIPTVYVVDDSGSRKR